MRGNRSAACVVLALALAGCAGNPPGNDTGPLVGTWRLTSFQMEVQGAAQPIFPMGQSPSGYVTFGRDGRMHALITAEGRKPPASEQDRAALYASLVAYTGRYRVEGGKWVTKVDTSANPAWVDTEQPRTFEVSGNTMREFTPWFPRADKSMVRVKNVWERVN